MTPEAARAEQSRRFRQMTVEQRQQLEVGLYRLACEVARDGIRHQHANASEEEVETLLHRRIFLGLHQA